MSKEGPFLFYSGALKAEQAYEVYRLRQDEEYISDFDREVKRIAGAS